METIKNVPRLRFPEFEGNWVKKNLGELSKNVMYGMNSCAVQYDGKNKYIRITDIDDTTREFTPNPLTSPDGVIDERYILSTGDIVFARTGASVGKSYLYKPKDGNLLFAGFLIRFFIENENPYFVYSYTLKESFRSWVQLMSMRSGQPGINAEEYKVLPIYITSITEQTKISNFHTNIDDKIVQLNKKKSLLEQYKKGVMQQLFSQELRFKDEDGNNFADWEEKTLGDVGEIVNGLTYSPDNVVENDGVLVLRSSNIQNRVLAFENNVYVNSINYNPVKERDILICVRNGSKNLIGKNAIIPKYQEGLAFGAFMTVYRSLYNDFIFHYFDTKMYYEMIHKNLGATINSINNSDLKSFVIPFPCRSEQQKIASFLSALDDKIAQIALLIEKMQLWKKGLLQQMFC